MKEEKFSIDPEDELQDIIEALGEVKADKITLVIPVNSKLIKERGGLNKLKEEILNLGKELIVESVDDKVIATAAKYDIRALNPFFNSERRIVSDVVVSHKNIKHRSKIKFEWPKFNVHLNKKWAAVLGVVILLLAGSVAIAKRELPIAKINLTLKEYPWDYKNNITIDANISLINIDKKYVPGMIFKETKTLTTAFAPSGKKNVTLRAKGLIKIINNFSNQPQVLVATTRFEAPGGMIYRIDNRTVVPGTKIVSGKVVQGSIETPITADGPGESYNAESIEYLTIPGFKNSPKFEKFYGQISAPVTGGFIGVTDYATEADIKNAKLNIVRALKDNLRATLILELPEGFKLEKDAIEFEIGEPVVNSNIKDGKFSLTLYGTISVFGFKEDDVLSLVRSLAKKQFELSMLASHESLGYKEASPDFNKKTMNLSIDYQSKFVNNIDTGKFIESILGRDEKDLESFILGLPGIDNVTVSLTPFWAKKLPKDAKKIKLNLAPKGIY